MTLMQASRSATPSGRETPVTERSFFVPPKLKGMLSMFFIGALVSIPVALILGHPLLYILSLALVAFCVYYWLQVDQHATSQAKKICRSMSQEQIMDKMRKTPDSMDEHVRSKTMKILNQPKRK